MNISDIEIVRELAKTLNFAKAAENLNRATSTLSRQLGSLEAELGVTLFRRTRHNVLITPAGRLFLEVGSDIASRAATLKEALRGEAELASGPVEIGEGDTDVAHFIMDCNLATLSRHKGIRVNVHSGTNRALIDGLHSGTLDFAVLPVSTDAALLARLPLGIGSRWGVVVRKSSRLASMKRVGAADLRGEPLIVPETDVCDEAIWPWLSDNRPDLRIVATYDTQSKAFVIVGRGLCHCLCTERAIFSTAWFPFTFVPLAPAKPIRYMIAWRKDRNLSTAAKAVLDGFKAAADKPFRPDAEHICGDLPI